MKIAPLLLAAVIYCAHALDRPRVAGNPSGEKPWPKISILIYYSTVHRWNSPQVDSVNKRVYYTLGMYCIFFCSNPIIIYLVYGERCHFHDRRFSCLAQDTYPPNYGKCFSTCTCHCSRKVRGGQIQMQCGTKLDCLILPFFEWQGFVERSGSSVCFRDCIQDARLVDYILSLHPWEGRKYQGRNLPVQHTNIRLFAYVESVE